MQEVVAERACHLGLFILKKYLRTPHTHIFMLLYLDWLYLGLKDILKQLLKLTWKKAL